MHSLHSYTQCVHSYEELLTSLHSQYFSVGDDARDDLVVVLSCVAKNSGMREGLANLILMQSRYPDLFRKYYMELRDAVDDQELRDAEEIRKQSDSEQE